MMAINLGEIQTIKSEFAKLQEKLEVLEDGILDIERYSRANIRILWILKQAPHYGEYNLPEWLANVAAENGDSIISSPTWRRMAYVNVGLQRKISFGEALKLSQEDIIDAFMSTAIIEIQKEMGDSHTSASTLSAGYHKYSYLIKRQIKAYAPHVIIVAMGGEWIRKAIVEDIYSSFSNGESYRINGEDGLDNANIRAGNADVAYTRANEISFLWTTHPQYSRNVSDKNYFDTLYTAYEKSRLFTGICG